VNMLSLHPITVSAPKTSRAWSPHVRVSSRSPSCRCLLSNCTVAALSPDSINIAPRLVVRKQPLVTHTSWLTSSCSSSVWPMVPRTWSPFHHSSELNMATDWTHAVMTFLQLAVECPICLVRLRSRAVAFYPSFSRVAWWLLSVSCESSHTPSHRVASLLNGTLLVPIVTTTIATVFSLWYRAASVLLWLKATPLLAVHTSATVAAAVSFATTSLSSAPSAHMGEVMAGEK